MPVGTRDSLIFEFLNNWALKLQRELKVGVVTLVAILGLYWGMNYLKGSDLFQPKRAFYAVYEHIDGLTTSRPVVINGYRIGSVNSIALHPDGSGKLIVSFGLTEDIQIPRNSVARLHSSDLLGDKAIELVLGDSPEMAEAGDTITSLIQMSLTDEVNAQVKPIKEKAEKLLSSLDSVVMTAQGFLNPEVQKNLTKSFASIRRSFESLENTLGTFNRTLGESEGDLKSSITNLAKITATMERNSDNIDQTFSNLANLSDSLSQIEFQRVFRDLEASLARTQSVMAKVDNGDGSLGLLINDPQLYRNLEELSLNMNRLMLDLKYNPQRYVNFSLFGGGNGMSEKEIEKREAKRKAESQP